MSVKSSFPGSFILRPFRGIFTGVIVLTLLTTCLEVFSLSAMIPLLETILGAKSFGQENQLIVTVRAFFNLWGSQNSIIVFCVFFFVLTTVKIVMQVWRDALRTILPQKVLNEFQKRIFEKTMRADLSYFIEHKSGDLVYRFTSLPREISAYFTLLPSLIVESLTVIVLSLLLWYLSPLFFLGVMIMGLCYGGVVWILSKRVFERMGKLIPESLAQQNIVINESLGGIREIITCNRRDDFIDHFRQYSDAYYKLRVKVSSLRLIPGSSLEWLVVAAACIAGIFFSQVSKDELFVQLPTLAVYVIAFMKMIPSFAKLGQERIQMMSYIPSVKAFEQLLNEPLPQLQSKGEVFHGLNQRILFNDISFAYVKDKQVLKSISLEIPKNGMVAFVGGSGAGKSTLVDLLLGLYQVQSGEIEIDGVPLRNYDAASWRSRIGVVAQHSFIFHASLEANIAFSFTDIDHDKVVKACRASGAEEFILGLKDGYQTILGDRGFKLSGGQRQRLAIARALYRDPEIIIFDEATSALDYHAERLVNQTVQSLAQQKTVIVLAHRLSAIEQADCIYVLKDGQIVQRGKFQELISFNEGEFFRLYKNVDKK